MQSAASHGCTYQMVTILLASMRTDSHTVYANTSKKLTSPNTWASTGMERGQATGFSPIKMDLVLEEVGWIIN